MFKKSEEPAPAKEEKEETVAAPKIFSVSEAVGMARMLIERHFSEVWIQGEVSGYKMHASGHHYFTLKDSGAVLPAAIFRGSAQKLKFKIEDGQELICHGKMSLYQKGGQYQIIVDYAEPKGVGELQLAFEQLKKKLSAEGLFDKARKRPIPFMPKRIGVVTSPTGAAVRDMLKVLRRRFPNIEVLIAPAKVQGPGSKEEIAGGIELLNSIGNIDVMIVGRGGGSIEDLWAFNEELVARAIYNSEIPVISAVGHEIDFTIADFVADFRAPTPSAAAEHAVPVRSEIRQSIVNLRRQLLSGLKRSVLTRRERLKDLNGRLSLPTRRFPEYYKHLDTMRESFSYAWQVTADKRENFLKGLEAELSHLSPLAVLSKGYSVVVSGTTKMAVRSSKILKTGDPLSIRFQEGSAEAKVTKVVD